VECNNKSDTNNNRGNCKNLRINLKSTGKARHQETTENRHTGQCTHTCESTNVKLQDVIMGNNITCVTHCNQKIAGKLYTLKTWFVQVYNFKFPV